MALNKKEQQKMADLAEECCLARALRWSESETLPDLAPPQSGFVNGWSLNIYREDIFPSWSAANCHGLEHRKPDSKQEYASQNGIKQYSTKELALRALRAGMERKFAKSLAKIDARIAAGSQENV